MHETLSTLHFKCLKYLCSFLEFSHHNPQVTKVMDSRYDPCYHGMACVRQKEIVK